MQGIVVDKASQRVKALVSYDAMRLACASACLKSGHIFLLTLLPFYYFTPDLLWAKGVTNSERVLSLGWALIANRVGTLIAYIITPWLVQCWGRKGCLRLSIAGAVGLAAAVFLACSVHLAWIMACGLAWYGLCDYGQLVVLRKAGDGPKATQLTRLAKMESLWLLGVLFGAVVGVNMDPVVLVVYS